MHASNPAAYECPKGSGGIHAWRIGSDQCAQCQNCGIVLTTDQTADLLYQPQSKKTKPIAVLAGSRKQYLDWVRQHLPPPYYATSDHPMAVHVTSQEKAKGCDFSRVEVVGDYYLRYNNARMLYDLCRAMVR